MSGISATERADFGVSYPVNLEPVPVDSGISKGYLRSAMGGAVFGEGPGVDRGGLVWNDVHYRVMGSKLVSVDNDGIATVLADVGNGGPVGLDYGFSLMSIQSGDRLYYWDGTTLTQVTDTDLGQCFDAVWFKGQYFSTDGKYVVALDLSEPTSVNPTKYGSAESDPDMVTGLIRNRNELAVLGENSIEFFAYTGGSGFPLSVSDGATIPVGCVGARAKCLFSQSFAFVGNARNQARSVWLAGSGTAMKLSTRAIDDLLAAEANPSGIELESRVSRDEDRLYVHLSDRTLVYLQSASTAAGKPVWYIARSGQAMDKAYRLRRAVLANNQWIAGDTESAQLAVLDDAEASHFGENAGWRFDTMLLYNGGKGAIVHALELVSLPGRGIASPPTAYWSYSLDGETWSMERAGALGLSGARGKRCQWRPHKRFGNYMTLRFRGDSAGLVGFAALEADVEALRT